MVPFVPASLVRDHIGGICMEQGPLYVAGHKGLVGSAIWRAAEAQERELVGRSRSELDLRLKPDVDDFMTETKPSQVVMAAARVGGILANSTYPAEFLTDNLQVQLNVLTAAVECQV